MSRATQVRQLANVALEPELGPEDAAAEAALRAWRRNAAEIALMVIAAAHVPVVVLGILGHGPPMGPLLKAIGIAIYLVVAAGAVFRRLDYRVRLFAAFFAIYIGLAVTNLFFPYGPYAQGVITAPVFALVLLGARAARSTIVASMAIIVSAPLLWAQPGVVRVLGIDLMQMSAPCGLVWFRTTVMAASLLALMVLLDRFHRFLSDALTQRLADQRKMEHVMRERQRLERDIGSVGDEERRRLGQELHDGICQQVTAALLRCQALERRLEKGEALSGADFTPLLSLLADTIDDAHKVVRGLCPLEPHPGALAPALRTMAKRMQEVTAIHCEFNAVGDVRVPDPKAAQHLYRIAQEAVSNAVRHAKPSRIAVELRRSNGELRLQVEDDGVGMSAALPADGMGLRTMAYRAQIINGELTVEPAPGSGTRVVCRVQLSAGAEAAAHQSGEERCSPVV